MNTDEFRKRGKDMIDYIANYLEGIGKRRVTPNVEPGFLRDLIPLEPPETPEKWDQVMSDVEDIIMPGITHWQHPRFHAYFPAGNSYPSILGDLLSSGLGIVGFSWASSPSCTELETIVMHWLGLMSGLDPSLLPFDNRETTSSTPSFDLNMNSASFKCENSKRQTSLVEMSSHTSNSEYNNINNSNTSGSSSYPSNMNSSQTPASNPIHCGGGVLLGSASECVLVSMLAARSKAISKYKRLNGSAENGQILTKLVAYTSKMAHSCVEKAASISLVKIRLLDYDENYALRGETLRRAVEEDLQNGFIPFYACGTFGTTCCCSYDNVAEMGPICQKYGIYLHVDAAYAGNALICDEFREYMRGIEFVDSFSYNPNKWMLVNFDCSCLWVRDKYILLRSLSVDPTYLQYRQMEKAIDYRNWGIPLSRRFKSLKLWFTIRSYGVEGLRAYIRNHVALAKEFEKLVRGDDRFEIIGKVTLGLVCFRLKGPDVLSQNLLYLLNNSGQIHMIPATIDNMYVIRFCVNYKDACLDDINVAWNIISQNADKVIEELKRERKNSFSRLNHHHLHHHNHQQHQHNQLHALDSSTPTLRQTTSATARAHNSSSSGDARELSYWVRTVSSTHNTTLNQMRSVDSWLDSVRSSSSRRLSNYSCKSEDNLDDLTATGEEVEIESPLRKPLFC